MASATATAGPATGPHDVAADPSAPPADAAPTVASTKIAHTDRDISVAAMPATLAWAGPPGFALPGVCAKRSAGTP